MDIQTRKIEFVKEFLSLQNEELITRLEKLLRANKPTSNNDFRQMTTAELNERINRSMEDSNHDRLTSSADLIAEIEKWG